jgi:hypothetical protein
MTPTKVQEDLPRSNLEDIAAEEAESEPGGFYLLSIKQIMRQIL